MSSKNSTISICKGIGIILMVIGHSGCPKSLHDFIYLFHMPLFFIITGFLFKIEYLDKPYTFLKRKLSALYRPFLLFNLLVLSIYFTNEIVLVNENISFTYYINRFLKIILFTGQYDILGSLWFLRTLFFSNIIVFILMYIQKNYRFNESFSIITSLILLFVGYYIHIYYRQIVYDVQRELITPILLIIGIIYKKYLNKIPTNIPLVILSFFLILFSSKFFTFDIAGSIIYNPFVYIFLSIIGFYLVYNISFRIRNIRLLAYIGDNSLSILLLHQIAFYTLQLFFYGTSEYEKPYNNPYYLIFSVYALIFSLLLDIVYKKLNYINHKRKELKNNNKLL